MDFTVLNFNDDAVRSSLSEGSYITHRALGLDSRFDQLPPVTPMPIHTSPLLYLQPMPPSDFDAFRQRSIEGYADDLQQRHGAAAHAHLPAAIRSFDGLLPKGLDTPEQHLLQIRLPQVHAPIGVLWYECEAQSAQEAFINEIEIAPAYRRQGHGRAALQLLQARLRAQGVTRLELSVFSHNRAARAFYRTLGFSPSTLTLGKAL